MTKAECCDWTWMADAADDGRLGEEQAGELLRHARGCEPCRRAVADATRLRQAMEALPEPTVSELHHHRERQRLLAGARRAIFDLFVAPVGRSWVPASLGAVAVAAIVFVGAQIIWSRGSGQSAQRVPPRYEVTGLDDATWINHEDGATARVSLSHGSAVFHVHHLQAGQRFLVDLPDGEIEVRGTRFVVDVERRSTRYVVVMEGKVAFRTTGQAERLLIAGQRWDASPSPIVAPKPAPTVDQPSPPTRREEPKRVLAFRSAHASTRGAEPPQAVASAATTPPSVDRDGEQLSTEPSSTIQRPVEERATIAQPSRLFAQALDAMRAGRYAEADVLWREFLTRHAGDPRAEDAAFLRVVGRARSGDRRGAAALARAYLAGFPKGMRRPEAERISREIP